MATRGPASPRSGSARAPDPAVVSAASPRGADAPQGGGRTDPASMRRANMGLILRHLRDQGGRSRARLAAETGLSPATSTARCTKHWPVRRLAEGRTAGRGRRPRP